MNNRILEYRRDFPLLSGADIAYLDNAATTQKPKCVLDAVRHYYEAENANPLRGVYELSEKATAAYESARAAVKNFIGAKSSDEIIFTSNASASINLVAYSYGLNYLKEGDEIVVSVMEHHSNFLPWKMVAEKTGAKLVKLCPGEDGYITPAQLDKVLTDKTKLVAVTQVSNVLGQVNDIKALAKRAHEAGAVILCDGAQSVPHMKVNVSDLDVDFLAFSGHKMLSPMGIGVLYGKRSLLEKMPPFFYGGEMIEIVHWDSVRYADIPHKFEAGTVNAGGAVGLNAAIEYIGKVGFDLIEEQERLLTDLAMDGLAAIEHVHIVGSQKKEDHKGIVTFIIDDVHPHDVAGMLSSDGVCVRAGHHCAQPLMDYLGVRSTTRVSFAFYNTPEEVERFLDSVSSVRKRMGY
ncbi:MAG: SufS family cysteine desulfurase [Lachnospiraceae bacterium]|nr:SufS family cysteine desulfurase [Lachnospiraceae bacterium]